MTKPSLNEFAKTIGLLRAFREHPYTSGHTMKDLGMMWLYATCLHEFFHKDFIIKSEQWAQLTLFLKLKYFDIDPPIRWTIPMSALESKTHSGIRWENGNDLIPTVREGCNIFLKIRKKRENDKLLDTVTKELQVAHGCC